VNRAEQEGDSITATVARGAADRADGILASDAVNDLSDAGRDRRTIGLGETDT
jgi:hypothetical protein